MIFKEAGNANVDPCSNQVWMPPRKKYRQNYSNGKCEAPLIESSIVASTEIEELLQGETAVEQMTRLTWQSSVNKFRAYCEHGTKQECRNQNKSNRVCTNIHFKRIVNSHTESHLGDCSYLNTCHRMRSCKYMHYTLDFGYHELKPGEYRKYANPFLKPPQALLPPQWIKCDIRKLDFDVIGKFAVILADPPWDIHMNLPYGTMTDDEMKELKISKLQDQGYLFLWVTSRAMELGRECMLIWGYELIQEMVWVKTNQLQRIIRTGRTGHWLNHSKEHCLIGRKGQLPSINKGLDCDVIVSEVRETSRKPDELYHIINRLSPGTRKLGKYSNRLINVCNFWQ